MCIIFLRNNKGCCFLLIFNFSHCAIQTLIRGVMKPSPVKPFLLKKNPGADRPHKSFSFFQTLIGVKSLRKKSQSRLKERFHQLRSKEKNENKKINLS
jgi:hypothetical protein